MNKISSILLALCLSLGASVTVHGSSISEENSKESRKRKLEDLVENSAKRLRGTLGDIQIRRERAEEHDRRLQEWLKKPPQAIKISFASEASSLEFLPWNEVYHKFGKMITSYQTRVWLGENNTTIVTVYKDKQFGEEHYRLEWASDEIKLLGRTKKEYYEGNKDYTFISSIQKLLAGTKSSPESFFSSKGPVKIVEITYISDDGYQIFGLASHWGYQVPFRATLPSPVSYPDEEEDESNESA